MTKRKKQLERLFSKPSDFEWEELKAVLARCGYSEISGSGSRVKFHDPESGSMLCLHRPHPGSIVKQYVLDQVVKVLEDRGIRP